MSRQFSTRPQSLISAHGFELTVLYRALITCIFVLQGGTAVSAFLKTLRSSKTALLVLYARNNDNIDKLFQAIGWRKLSHQRLVATSVKPWPNGVASRRKLKTWVYLRLRGWPGCLHNAVEELNSGLPRTSPDSSRAEDLNQGPPHFKSSALNHSALNPNPRYYH